MGSITVHYDDSGTAPDQIIAVAACYIASPEQWIEFSRNWKEIDDAEHFGVFHMAEFAARQKGTVFETWDDAKCKRVLAKLCTAITIRARLGIARAVLKADYDEVITGPFRQHCGDFHYTFVLRQCIGRMGAWRSQYAPSSSLRYIFDRMAHREAKKEIDSVMNAAIDTSDIEAQRTGKVNLSGFSFENKALILPLQAADILAWTVYQQMQRLIWGKTLKWEAEMAFDLLKNSHSILDAGFFAKDRLAEWAEAERSALSRHQGT